MAGPVLRIATMSAAEVEFAVQLAADEGWNPGLHDGSAFHAADPDGFLIGYLDGEPIGCISAVSYPGHFGFIGLYIVVPHHRSSGYGIQLWNAAMQRLAGHNIGLDGVLAQQDNYRRSGFRMAYSNIRFERSGVLAHAPAAAGGSLELAAAADVDFSRILEYDRSAFPAAREPFLRHWLTQPDSRALACIDGTALRGYGVIRKCRRGFKIGPLFADDPESAAVLYRGLCRDIPAEQPVYLDIPEVNAAGLSLAAMYGMQQVFGTARMYTGEFPQIPLERVFGVTTFELG